MLQEASGGCPYPAALGPLDEEVLVEWIQLGRVDGLQLGVGVALRQGGHYKIPHGSVQQHTGDFPSKVCLLFYVLTTSKVISGWVPTCDSSHSLQLYSDIPLEDQATRPLGPDIPLSPIILTPSKPALLYPKNSEHLARKEQVSILKSLKKLIVHGVF